MFFIREFQTPKISRIGDMALLVGVILAGTVFPRLMVLGYPPVSDDGYYIYIAQQIYHSLANGQGIPDTGGISFYPMLCAWAPFLQYNPFIALRLIDLGVAVIMAFLLYKVLARICNNNTGAALITLVFTFTLNQPVFIDSGFKNSIVIAFVPLLLALYIGTRAIQDRKSGNTWWMAGALTALAVVFRETFVPFAVLGLVSVFIAQGKKAALQFFIGGMATGILLIGGVLAARGGIAETIAHYRSASIIFDTVPGDRRLENFITYGSMAIHSSVIAMTFSALAIVALLAAIFFRRDNSILLAAGFWLFFIVTALIETATKICYAYHFAIALPGFAGLCALALREIILIWPVMRWMNKRINYVLAVASAILLVAWIYFSCSVLAMAHWPVTLETLIAAPGGKWPEKFTNQSDALFVAAEIKKVIPENGTLSINGGAHLLYPLTGHFPPAYRLSDLSATAILLNFSIPDIRQVLLDCAPDVIMITVRDWLMATDGNAPLIESILATGIYEATTEILIGKQNSGHFANVIIFRRTKEMVCSAKQGMAEWIRRGAALREVTGHVLHPPVRSLGKTSSLFQGGGTIHDVHGYPQKPVTSRSEHLWRSWQRLRRGGPSAPANGFPHLPGMSSMATTDDRTFESESVAADENAPRSSHRNRPPGSLRPEYDNLAA
ncbi:MAG: glycosyltransferase family 39 protein [Zoogloeaceae bacterium]|jgi:hypothetical protein|nr:glycosyltransferase family 39 protein [Zoogloeaceae bacterium]